MSEKEFHLCYMETNYEDHIVFWFATCDATECWGDDWDDAPFEHNAGEPYLVKGSFYHTVAIPRERITDLITDKYTNTPYSVRDLNHNRELLCKIGGVGIRANDTLDKIEKALNESLRKKLSFKDKKKYSYKDIADWILSERSDKYIHNKEAGITLRALQYMVYFAYVAYLCAANECIENEKTNKLFDDGRFEAWISGPIIPELFEEYKGYWHDPITEVKQSDGLDPEIEIVIGSFIDSMVDLTDLRITESEIHSSDPWVNARGDLLPLDRCHNHISDEDIYDYYSLIVN